MRRARSEDDDELSTPAAAASAAPSGGADPHPVLTRPALLSHIFKFVVRKHGDGVKLLHVHSAWEDTAISYCPWMWERLLRFRGGSALPPSLPGTSLEQHSQVHFREYLLRVWVCDGYCASLLSRISTLVPLVRLDLSGCTKLDDAGLEHIGKLVTLRELNLSGGRVWNGGPSTYREVTDDGMVHLANLRKLRKLSISYFDISDDGIKQLRKLKKLEELTVSDCADLTDTSIRHIRKHMGALRKLSVQDCKRMPTKSAAKRFTRARPEVEFEFEAVENEDDRALRLYLERSAWISMNGYRSYQRW
jgi:hypothetical protein